MSLKDFSKVPLVGPLFSFDLSSHKNAFAKFLFLYVASTAPVLALVLFSEMPDGELTLVEKFLARLNGAFTLREQFVYTASFVSPLIYIAISRIERRNDGIFEQISRAVFPGYRHIFLFACLILIVTTVAYGAGLAAHPARFESTFYFGFMYQYSWWLYGLSVYIWYLTLLDETVPQDDFVDKSRKDEEDFTKALNARARGRRRG